jgi:uncharacterized protein (TIGR03435 family)
LDHSAGDLVPLAVDPEEETILFREQLFNCAKSACLVAIICAPPCVFGQNTSGSQSASADSSKPYTPHLAFDVVSIRKARETDMSTIYSDPQTSLFSAGSLTIWGLIVTAYDIKIMTRIEGLPKWAKNDYKYDIQAKSDEATDKVLSKLSKSDSLAEKRHMLQLMLAERFHLRVHPETRLGTTYELNATPKTASFMTPFKGDELKFVNDCSGRVSQKGIEIESRGCPLYIFVHYLTQRLQTDIVDRTGMAGVYAFHLTYSTGFETPPPDVELFPELRVALREQLGLELKPTKAPVTYLIVDHVEQPTPN